MLKNEKIQAIKEIKELMEEFKTSDDKINSYLIRFHRMYLDGSYGSFNPMVSGENLYKIHVGRFTRNIKEENYSKYALSTFKNFISIEFFNRKYNVPLNEVEKILEEGLGKYKDEFMNYLINDIKDFRIEHLN